VIGEKIKMTKGARVHPREEAKAIADAGMDLVVASGFEAGGHRGSLIGKSEASLAAS
jgi:NAD(P)H-dependent flavin oxidoreductase YrpB (nitropropane dioxygenase family)